MPGNKEDDMRSSSPFLVTSQRVQLSHGARVNSTEREHTNRP